MSTVKSKKLQVGTDATSSNNFTIYQPAVPDGTLRIGVGNADSPTEVGRFDSNGLNKLGTATGDAPSYSARAWVNFNGTGTVAIRESGNVSSITDDGVGLYTVNFTTAMSDASYCVNVTQGNDGDSSVGNRTISIYAYSTSSVSFTIRGAVSTSAVDANLVNVAIFR